MKTKQAMEIADTLCPPQADGRPFVVTGDSRKRLPDSIDRSLALGALAKEVRSLRASLRRLRMKKRKAV